jgi:hypothetical protein
VRPEEIAWHWIETVERTPPESCRPVSDFGALPEPPMPDSLLWCGTIFGRGNPHHPPNAARHPFHLATLGRESRSPAPQYRAADLDLVVTEGVDFVLIRAVSPAQGVTRRHRR